MQTPFDNPACPTPSAEGNFRGTRGGADFPEGRKETAGQGGIPALPTIDSFTGDTPPGPRDITSYMANQTFHSGKG